MTKKSSLRRLGIGLSTALLASTCLAVQGASAAKPASHQPTLESRGAPIISVGKNRFRDLDRNGRLTPYEDWRLTSQRRAADLVGLLSLEQKAGQLVHGSLTNAGTSYDTSAYFTKLHDRHITTYITRLSTDTRSLAEQHNMLQAAAEAEPFGIPLKISTDPRNGFTVTAGQTVANGDFSAFPDPIGIGAIHRPALTRAMGEVIRKEYRAVGIHEGLSPQADIATEPRWSRINGTFGSKAELASPHVAAYVAGVQGNARGRITPASVTTVVKHWVGYGAQVNGYDSHYYYGRYAGFPGNNLAEHVEPFEAAFAAGAAGVMPTYSILKDLRLNGQPLEQVGAGHNEQLLNLLKDVHGFEGVITSDWGITGDCPQACMDNRPPSHFVGPWGAGMPWGVEDLTRAERFASTINAGVDIVGGDDNPQYIVQAVNEGLLATARVDAAARRVLAQKFELGLFEDPFVDPAAAATVFADARADRLADEMQSASLTLLHNPRKALPVTVPEEGLKVYLHGIAPASAEQLGLTVVDSPEAADLAVIRLSDPKSGPDLTGLDWTGSEPGYRALLAADAAGVSVVASPQLTRPLILTEVVKHSDAVLANYGVSDKVLLHAVLGRVKPAGTLPMELPSTMAEVEAQLSDVPDDTKNPLFDAGHGLRYRGR